MRCIQVSAPNSVQIIGGNRSPMCARQTLKGIAMDLYVIFGQRREGYPGEFAVEALDLMDEYGYDDNAEWLTDKVKEYRLSNEFIAVEIVRVRLGPTAEKLIQDRLTGTLQVSGTVE